MLFNITQSIYCLIAMLTSFAKIKATYEGSNTATGEDVLRIMCKKHIDAIARKLYGENAQNVVTEAHQFINLHSVGCTEKDLECMYHQKAAKNQKEYYECEPIKPCAEMDLLPNISYGPHLICSECLSNMLEKQSLMSIMCKKCNCMPSYKNIAEYIKNIVQSKPKQQTDVLMQKKLVMRLISELIDLTDPLTLIYSMELENDAELEKFRKYCENNLEFLGFEKFLKLNEEIIRIFDQRNEVSSIFSAQHRIHHQYIWTSSLINEDSEYKNLKFFLNALKFSKGVSMICMPCQIPFLNSKILIEMHRPDLPLILKVGYAMPYILNLVPDDKKCELVSKSIDQVFGSIQNTEYYYEMIFENMIQFGFMPINTTTVHRYVIEYVCMEEYSMDDLLFFTKRHATRTSNICTCCENDNISTFRLLVTLIVSVFVRIKPECRYSDLLEIQSIADQYTFLNDALLDIKCCYIMSGNDISELIMAELRSLISGKDIHKVKDMLCLFSNTNITELRIKLYLAIRQLDGDELFKTEVLSKLIGHEIHHGRASRLSKQLLMNNPDDYYFYMKMVLAHLIQSWIVCDNPFNIVEIKHVKTHQSAFLNLEKTSGCTFKDNNIDNPNAFCACGLAIYYNQLLHKFGHCAENEIIIPELNKETYIKIYQHMISELRTPNFSYYTRALNSANLMLYIEYCKYDVDLKLEDEEVIDIARCLIWSNLTLSYICDGYLENNPDTEYDIITENFDYQYFKHRETEFIAREENKKTRNGFPAVKLPTRASFEDLTIRLSNKYENKIKNLKSENFNSKIKNIITNIIKELMNGDDRCIPFPKDELVNLHGLIWKIYLKIGIKGIGKDKTRLSKLENAHIFMEMFEFYNSPMHSTVDHYSVLRTFMSVKN